MSKYRDFLERTQNENAEDYPEISDLESRHKTLISSNKELVEGQRKIIIKNEQQRTKFSDYTKKETNNMLNFNNTIANLQQKLERAEAEAAQSQEELDQSIHKAGSETLMVGQVIMAVQNLLQQCTKNHGAIKHYDDSKEQQWDAPRRAKDSGGGVIYERRENEGKLRCDCCICE